MEKQIMKIFMAGRVTGLGESQSGGKKSFSVGAKNATLRE
jgi:hypothetical protein